MKNFLIKNALKIPYNEYNEYNEAATIGQLTIYCEHQNIVATS